MRKKTIMSSRKSVDWMFQALMISMLLGISWKDKHKIRGDHRRLAKNPLMVKSVFLEFQFVWKCLNALPSCKRVLILCLSEAVISPTIVEFKRLRGNFHNSHGSFIIWPVFSTTVCWGNGFVASQENRGRFEFVSKEHVQDARCSSNWLHGRTSLSLDEHTLSHSTLP